MSPTTTYVGTGLDIVHYDPLKEVTPAQQRVIDTTRLDVSVEETPKQLGHTTYGSDYAEFSKKLSVRLGVEGGYGGFSASSEVGSAQSSQIFTTSQWVRIESIVGGQLLSIGEDARMLRDHLDANFKRALTDSSPEEIFDAYGTHVVVKVKIGGRASYDCSSSESSTLDENSFTMSASAKFTSLGAEGGASTEIKEATSEYQKQIRGGDTLDIHGGTPRKQALVKSAKSTDAWANWVESVMERPAILEFPSDGLLPIWELAADPSQQKELQAAFHRRVALHPVIVVFSNTSEVDSHPSCEAFLPPHFKLLSGGARVNWRFGPGKPGSHLYASYPSSDSSWEARAKDHLKADKESVTAYAVGLYDPYDLWKVETTESTSKQKSESPESQVEVKDGYCLVGGGAFDHWKWSSGPGNHLIASRPGADKKSWFAAGHDHAKPDATTITSYAIGLKLDQGKIEGVRLNSEVQKSQPSSEKSHPSESQRVLAKQLLTGGGAECHHSGKSGQILVESYPSDLRTWKAKSKDHIYSDIGTVTAYAVGITVEASES